MLVTARVKAAIGEGEIGDGGGEAIYIPVHVSANTKHKWQRKQMLNRLHWYPCLICRHESIAQRTSRDLHTRATPN